MNLQQPLLTIVIPCYNEEDVFAETAKQLTAVLDDLTADKLISAESKLLFVDDGSTDRTWPLIAMESTRNRYVTGLKLARNSGHQKALLAGLDKAKQKSDCVISIDADLQDDISAIRRFIEKYHEGYEIVYGVRRSRKTDTWFKRTTAAWFYRIMNKLGIQLIDNHADFRLLNKRALEELSRYAEANVFLRGLVPLIGLRSAKVFYDRKERLAGETKYPLKKCCLSLFTGLRHSVSLRSVFYPDWLLLIFPKLYRRYICNDSKAARLHECRLGFVDHFDMVFGRFAIDGDRHYRRIYRNDFHRSEKKAEVCGGYRFIYGTARPART